MGQILQLTKVEQRDGIWCVLILSAFTGEWIVQAEWKTQEAAEADRKNWTGARPYAPPM